MLSVRFKLVCAYDDLHNTLLYSSRLAKQAECYDILKRNDLCRKDYSSVKRKIMRCRLVADVRGERQSVNFDAKFLMMKCGSSGSTHFNAPELVSQTALCPFFW